MTLEAVEATVAAAIVGIGLLVGIVVAVLIGIRKVAVELEAVRKLTSATAAEVSPNHGSSMKDQLSTLTDQVHSIGHQIGEIRDDARIIHEDHAARLRRLETQRR